MYLESTHQVVRGTRLTRDNINGFLFVRVFILLSVFVLISGTMVFAQECNDELLVAPVPLEGEHFGTAMDVDGITLVVGAPGDGRGESEFVGRVFVYELGTDGDWELRATLTDGGGDDGDTFGRAVAIDGPTIVVGSRFALDTSEVQTGKVCVFNRGNDGWETTSVPDHVLYSSDGEDRDAFGSGVEVSGDWIFVGAPLAESAELDSGAV